MRVSKAGPGDRLGGSAEVVRAILTWEISISYMVVRGGGFKWVVQSPGYPYKPILGGSFKYVFIFIYIC